MHVNVMIATRDRWDTLHRVLESLERSTYKDISIHIILDKNPSNIPEWLSKSNFNLVLSKESGNVVSKMGSYTNQCIEGSLFLADDDSILYPDCLEQAVKSMQQYFPDKMGVIGINQQIDGRPQGMKDAFVLMNRKFIDHFPKRIVYCPDYFHYYCDTELGMFARSVNGFYFCEAAKLDHLRLKDEVTSCGRQYIPKDTAMFDKRKAMGYLWGKNFNLIGKDV